LDRQQILDRYYFAHGKCCAGCDWWRHESGVVGECTKNAPVSAAERYAMLGIESTSMPLSSGHVLTKRDHVCGDFADTFDWSSLPLPYRVRVGDPTLKRNR
jgi:hypothetical protein